MKRWILILALLAASSGARAQIKLTQDTLACPIIGFSFGTQFASGRFSTEGGMHSLYKSPYLNFGLDGTYKTKSGWLAGIDGSLVFGNDNLRNRQERMGDVYSHDNTAIVIGTNGTDATVSCYNRALTLRAGFGKIFFVDPAHNPNSGIVARLYGGLLQQKTIFTKTDVNAPQLEGDYTRLYDHKRRGFTLTQSIGYWYMSNNANLVNLYAAFEITECWNHSVRDYVIDNYMGLHGPDTKSYLDLLYTIKVCWMFPLKGKTAYDYYFY